MANGDETYNVTVKDWIGMEKTLERLDSRLDQREKTDEKMADTLDGINNTLSNLNCAVHSNEIKTLKERPSPVKIVSIGVAFLGLLIAALKIWG